MDIDWTQVRETLKRIERELSKTEAVVAKTDAEVVHDWPQVRKADLEAAYPQWRRDYGPSWSRDFLDKVIGHSNYRWLPGARKYRIAPEVYRALNLGRLEKSGHAGSAAATSADPEK